MGFTIRATALLKKGVAESLTGRGFSSLWTKRGKPV